MTDHTVPPAEPLDKAQLRGVMRPLRRSLPDREPRAEALWRHVIELPAMFAAETVLAFTSLPGEPDTGTLMVWCASTGRLVAVPEGDVDPTWPDVVVVPGLAYTAAGDRLGQGGGWYDRFLAEVRPDCISIGVCFVEQIVESLPVESHDIVVDHVVTDAGVLR
jgi:5-formyltetrahydrofolate cyclo-ligase